VYALVSALLSTTLIILEFNKLIIYFLEIFDFETAIHLLSRSID